MKLKKYFTVFLSAALGATMLVGCSPKVDDKTQNNQTTTTKEISVVSPDGLPAISIAKMAKEKPVIKDGYNTTYEVINTTEALSTTVMKQEPDIAIVPSNMAAWNLCRFAESLIPLIDEDSKIAIDLAQGIIHKFSSLYSQNYLREFKNKLGIFNSEENDKELIQELLDLMNKYKEDFTNTFVSLTYKVNMDKGMFISQEFSNWYEKYQQRLSRQSNSIEEVYNLMKNSNPVIIPRNHKVEEALSSAENGDLSFMSNLLSALKNPYDRSENLKQYQEGQNPSCSHYRTYCGT